jgi:hypothetical protein
MLDAKKQMGSFDSSQEPDRLRNIDLITVLDWPQKIQGDDMTSPAETALSLVVVKSLAIVGSALTAVFLLALFGVKKR